MYGEDGVHFNAKRNATFGKMITWLQEKERHGNRSARQGQIPRSDAEIRLGWLNVNGTIVGKL